MSKWLKGSEDNHELCRQQPTISQASMPRRLVRIDDVALSLVSYELEMTTRDCSRYAALSHCWSDPVPLKATRANLSRLSQGIPSGRQHDTDDTEQLPRTFREAVDLCRALDINYIWIDSLCIVQVDPEEWRVEAAKMGSVYANALLTIAATGAADSSEGCFPDPYVFRDDGDRLRKSRVTSFSISTASCGAGNGFPEEEGGHIIVRVYPYESGGIDQPVNLRDRGWTLQEHVLSSRIVHCADPELQWQCKTAFATEAGVTVRSTDPDLVCMQLATQLDLINDPRLRQQKADQIWRDWMEEYLNRSFTVREDRLAALAGMVQWAGAATSR